ncbi:metal ABC transporter permease [Sulfurimonas paralvinellae]|uniref:Manganese transporter n=1 Tax=Sulfurimonas paralvinellae TaxID=317658 RepID=A0A7M1B881_9BACT|nr:metal ABC transporter permease [Sulfurimonas paralvinellae]QOP45930.1 manganese transporter [Sulfurimonas paralvinellae]
MQIIELLWPAFVLAILLVYIHTIFGVEIIRRGVIFTDLAIGQVAAIGMALSVAFLDGAYQTALTLAFAVSAAIIIAWATKNVKNVEAFIGLLYALGISSIMLVLAKSAEGMELFSKLSAADILFTSSDELYKDAAIYIPISLVMFFLYPRTKGIAKELIFFIMLAFTVTSSVQSAGVLVVFALLIAPAYAGIVQKKFNPLYFAWMFGSLSIVIALYGSYNLDLPTGYSIIFVTVLFSLLFVVYKNVRSNLSQKLQ